MNDTKFYYAYATTDIKEKFRFEIEEIEVNKIFENGTIETKYPYFYCRDDSTRYFGTDGCGKEDSEIKLSDTRFVFYSTSKEKCKEYLESKRKELIDYADKMLERLNQSAITEIENTSKDKTE